jgi:hypothetical protein
VYKELGVELASLKEKISHMPERPLMMGETKYDGTRCPLKILLEEVPLNKRNRMMDSFAEILWWLPTGGASSSNLGVAPFKV